jgi:hypothetical protein
MAGSVSHVTGGHNVKVGLQDMWAGLAIPSANGDLRHSSRAVKAFQARILNTPVRFEIDLDADIGIWRAGLVDGQSPDDELRRALGAFASLIPKRPDRGCRRRGRSTDPDADLKAPAPAGVDDLFGNQKTALKVSVGKFMQQGTTGFSNCKLAGADVGERLVTI